MLSRAVSKGNELACADVSFPLRLPLEECADELHVEAAVAGLRTVVTRGMLRADAELQLALHGYTPVTHRVLREASFGEAQTTPRDACPEIYYPAAGERLWDVAKQYGIAPDILADRNGISAEAPGSAESLDGKRFLRI